MDIEIRRGLAADSSSAVPLLLSAAESLLISVFGNEDRDTTIGFLTHAWQAENGQYGCGSHWVALIDDRVVGVITGWHAKLGSVFERASLDSVTSFFHIDEAISVLMRNQTIAVSLTPPSSTELMLGHVAVDESVRRAGVGRALIEHMREHAQALNKHTMVLDVQLSNIPAIRFYQNLNFIEQSVSGNFIRFVQRV